MHEGRPLEGVLCGRALPDGRAFQVIELMFGRARLCLGPLGAPWYDDGW